MSVIGMAEVRNHKKRKSAWIVIRNDIYDVTKFLNEHPGGLDILMQWAGKDGTKAFDDVGHSDDAIMSMCKYKIGSLPPNERRIFIEPCCECTALTRLLPMWRPWRVYDGSADDNYRSLSARSSPSSAVSKDSASSLKPGSSRRVHTIIVPKESWWKWLLLALAVAGMGAFTYKKMKAA